MMNFTVWQIRFALAMIVVLGFVAPALAYDYSLVDLGVIAGGDTGSEATAINASGFVVGTSGTFTGTSSPDLGPGHGYGIGGGILPLLAGAGLGKNAIGTHSFLWSPTSPNAATGNMTDLGALPGNGCKDNAGTTQYYDMYATGINSSGKVVGGSDIFEGGCLPVSTYQAALLNDGAVVGLGLPAGFGGSYGTGINVAGIIVGSVGFPSVVCASVLCVRPFVYDVGGYHLLGQLPGFDDAFALGINGTGRVVGAGFSSETVAHAFLHVGTDSLTAADDIGSVLGGGASSAFAVNDAGNVVGVFQSAPSSPFHAFLLEPSNTGPPLVTDLGALGLNQSSNSGARGINAANDVVGWSDADPALRHNFSQHAVLWKAGGTIVDLNSLIDPTLGLELINANAINDSGQIVGWGFLNVPGCGSGSNPPCNQVEHAYLLTPQCLGDPPIASLTLAPPTVAGLQATTATITLACAAPVIGAQITLTSSRAVANVPAAVTVFGGQSVATFTISTQDVDAVTTVQIQAFYGASVASATLTIQPLLEGVSVNDVCALNTSIGTVTLRQPASSSGVVVSLNSSDSTVATVPATVLVLPGQSFAAFDISGEDIAVDADGVSSPQIVITATLDGATQSGKVSVTHLVDSVLLSDDRVQGGHPVVGTVSLGQCSAPQGGATVYLGSDTPSVAAPSVNSILVPANANSGSFAIGTTPVTVDTPVTLTARTPALLVAQAQKATLTVTVKAQSARDVTNLVSVIPGGFHYNHTTQRYLQDVLLINQTASQTTLPAPIWLVLNSTPNAPWTLVGWTPSTSTLLLPAGTTSQLLPAGRPYITINQSLNPGDIIDLTLQFTDPTNEPIIWFGPSVSPQVLAGPGTP